MEGKTSNLDVIRELFAGKREEYHLSDSHMQYLRSLRAAYGMLLDVKPKKYVAGVLMMQFDVSQATCYRIIKDAEELFGDINKVNKAWSRHMAVEMAKECYDRARKRENTKDMISATKAFIEATGISLEDADMPDFEKLQPSLVVAVLPEGMEDDIRSLLRGGAVNLNTATVGEYIEHEEVDPGRSDQAGDTAPARTQ